MRVIPHLLAKDGTKYNERFGTLGVALHDKTKWMVRKGVDLAWMKYKPVHEYKQKHGWMKSHVAALDEGWRWVMSLDEMPINVGIGGFKGPKDKNRTMLYRAGQMFFGMCDEDSRYDIRILLLLKWVHEHWELFEQSAENAYQISNFGNLYKDLLHLSEPLPEDDGIDVGDVDYVKMEDKLRKTKKGSDPSGME